MKKHLLKIGLGSLILIVLMAIVFFTFVVRNEVDLITTVEKSEDNIKIHLDYSESLNKFYSYSVTDESGVFSIKVKVAPIFGENWPVTILIDEKPEDVKSIEIVDGSKTKVIYP